MRQEALWLPACLGFVQLVVLLVERGKVEKQRRDATLRWLERLECLLALVDESLCGEDG